MAHVEMLFVASLSMQSTVVVLCCVALQELSSRMSLSAPTPDGSAGLMSRLSL